MVKARVIQVRRGRHNYAPRHFLIEIDNCNTREKAEKFKGYELEWQCPGKEKKVLKGKIVSAHGNKGVVRAIFEKGLPGQALGTEIAIKGGKE